MLQKLLCQVRDRELYANSTYCPREIGARLGVFHVDVELAMIEAEQRELVKLDRRWTGSYRRVLLTDAGKEAIL